MTHGIVPARHWVVRVLIRVLLGCLLAGCGVLIGEDLSPCRPVDVGGECFSQSREAFIDHALISAGAWPQLDANELSADRVIEGTDLSQKSPTWLVPLLDDGRMVAISRFVPVAGDQVKLAEVALLEEPLDALAMELEGELVLFVDVGCVEDPSIDCLFNEMRWAVRLPSGAYELPDGSVVEQLPVRSS